MRRVLNPLQSVSVLLTMIALLFAILLLLGSRTFAELERQQAGPTDSAQWMIFQTSLEFNRLSTAYSRFLIEDSPETRRELNTRFDIFYSRIGTLKSARAFDSFRGEDFFAKGLNLFSVFVDRIARMIDRKEYLALRIDPTVAGDFHAVERNVAGFVTSAVQTQAAWDNATRQALRKLLLMQLVTTGIVLLAFLYFAYVVLQQRNSAVEREAELRESRDLLRTTVKSSLDGVLIANAKGTVLDMNDAAANMFGYSPAEMAGGEMANLIVPERLRAAHRAGMERYLSTGVAKVIGRRVELDALRRDGTEFPVELSISSTGAGTSAQFVAFMRDITERRMAESSLQAAKDRAEAASRAKAQFLAAISHEMRTPLTGILGALDLISRTELSDIQRKYLQTADRSSHALLSVISDVLDISRLESGKIDLDYATLNLRLMVDDVVEIVGKLARERGNRISIRIDDRLALRLMGDQARIRQVLLNLATNAVKFTYEGSIDISVMLSGRRGNLADVEFAVRDTGPGIAESDKEKLFQNFSQLGNVADGPMAGSGLGLAISNRLVELMSGSIGVDSELGKGSRFWFRLPLEVELGPALAETGATATMADVPAVSPKSILVVDDNETVRSIIAGQLASRGHAAETADGAVRGLAMMKSTGYDAVILDISMPVMDGFEALQIIRNMPGEAGRTPVIALTAHALIEDRERCLAAGFDQFLTKPVRADELAKAIAEVTSGAAASARAELAPARPPQATLFALDDLREQFVSVSPADLRRIVERFDSELENQLGLLTGEGSDISPHHLRRIVHVLAGSASMIGAKRLATLASELDAMATRHEDAELAARLPDLVALIRDTRGAIDTARGSFAAEGA